MLYLNILLNERVDSDHIQQMAQINVCSSIVVVAIRTD